MRFYLSFLLLGLAALPAQAKTVAEYAAMARPLVCRPLDLTFVLDHSGSIPYHSDQNWPDLINFCKDVVDDLARRHAAGITSYVAAVAFDNTANVSFPFINVRNTKSIKDGLDRIPYPTINHKKTNIADALTQALGLSHGGRKNPQKVALLISDGGADVQKELVQESAKKLRDSGTHIIAVAIETQDYDEEELLGIVGGNRNKIIKIGSFGDLKVILNAILTNICNPEPECQNCRCPSSCSLQCSCPLQCSKP